MGSNRRTVVIAEDHDDQRALFALACEREGFDVLEASNGHELVELLRTQHDRGWLPEVVLVISDIMMPGLTGLDAREALARDGVEVPFLFVSAASDPETRSRALVLPSLGLLEKPFEIETLRRFLRERTLRPDG
ncbi:MAG TPA: response regulator [Polyangiaceae bacterium]|nr:response regulator [Polyangiaceae bacterium]